MEDRVADTKVLFADLAVLARHADAFIVSNNSNLGRIAFLLAGKKRILETRMRGFDLYWCVCLFPRVLYALTRGHRFPTLFKPIFDAGCASLSPPSKWKLIGRRLRRRAMSSVRCSVQLCNTLRVISMTSLCDLCLASSTRPFRKSGGLVSLSRTALAPLVELSNGVD